MVSTERTSSFMQLSHCQLPMIGPQRLSCILAHGEGIHDARLKVESRLTGGTLHEESVCFYVQNHEEAETLGSVAVAVAAEK